MKVQLAIEINKDEITNNSSNKGYYRYVNVDLPEDIISKFAKGNIQHIGIIKVL